MRNWNRSIMAFALMLGISAPLLAATVQSTPIPLTHAINVRLATQWKEIQTDLRNGKIRPQQAFALKTTLKKVRLQEITFFKQNNNHELTTDQQTQLNAILDQNEQAIKSASTTD